MPALVALALVLPVFGSKTTIDLAGGEDLSLRGGLIPLSAGADSQLALSGKLLLLAGMRAQSARSSMILHYRPQFLSEHSKDVSLDWPIVFHSGGLSYTAALDRRVDLETSLQSGGGEVSFDSVQGVFEPGTSTPPVGGDKLFFFDANSTLGYRSTKRNTLSVGASGGYRSPTGGGSEDEIIVSGIPTSYNLSFNLRDSFVFTKRDNLSGSVRAGYLYSRGGGSSKPLGDELIAGGGTFTWNRTLKESSSVIFTMGGGVTYSLGERIYDFIPNATASHSSSWQRGRQVWSSVVSGGVSGFLDRISATYRTRAFLSWGVNGAIGRDWSTGFSLFGAMPLFTEPQEPPQYESTLSFSLPSSYRLTSDLLLRFGATASVRAPHYLSIGTLESEFEVSGFLGLRHTFGTGSGRGAWLP